MVVFQPISTRKIKMKKALLIFTVSAGVLLASCGNPSSNETVDAADAGETAEATAESVTYNVNLDES